MTNRREFLRTVGLGLAVGATATCTHVGRASRRDPRPNILFLFPDQLRHDWIEPSENLHIRTPNVKQLASKGMRFTRAVTPSPVCAPARACIACGKEYDNCRVPSNGTDYPLDQPTFYQMLRDAGYAVLGCGKFDLHKNTKDWGLDGKRLIHEWGFTDGIDNSGKHDGVNTYKKNGKPMGPYFAYLENRGMADVHIKDFAKRKKESAFPTPLPDDAYCDNWIARNGLELLRHVSPGTPWFLQVNFNGPHSPWDVTENMHARWQDVDFPQPNGNKEFTPEQHVAIRRNYAAMIENIDSWVGKYVDAVAERGELDNTLIVFSSDHGEMLGDHNRWSKSVPYHPSAGVPLVVSGPGVQAGVSDAPMTTMDLTATFLDYAGLPAPADMDSKSLKPYLEGRTSKHRDFVLSGLTKWRFVFDGRYKYVEVIKDEPMLFDLETDPLENVNLAESRPDIVARLKPHIKSPGQIPK